MFKFGIRARLSVSIIFTVVLITMILVGYFSFHHRESDKESAFALIKNTGEKVSSDIVGRLNIDLGRTRSLAASFEAYGISDQQEVTSKITPVLLQTMKDNTNYLAFWISLELNSVDPAYKNRPGRKTWLADRLDGELQERVEFRSLNGEPESSQYLEIKRTKNETLIDPYFYYPRNYKIDMDSILEATVGVPVMSGSSVIGLAGIDFKLDQFDSIIKRQQGIFKSVITLVSNDGTIVASTHPDILIGHKITDETLFGDQTGLIKVSISQGKSVHELVSISQQDDYYFSATPVRIGSSNTPWAICLTAPMTEINKSANQEFFFLIFLGLIGILLMGILVFYISVQLVKPITATSLVLDSLSQGDMEAFVKLDEHENHELGMLAGSTNRIQDRFKAIVGFASDIGRGKLDTVYPFNTEKDMLGKALEEMQSDLIHLHRETSAKDWYKTGTGGLNDAMRGGKDLTLLAAICIQYLSEYLQVPVGAIYYSDESRQVLHFGAGYSFSKPRDLIKTINFGEGLVGQCAADLKSIILKQVPDDYLPVKSATGSATPKEIVVVPCIYNDKLVAVIELGKLSSFSPEELELLKNFADTIAITVQTVKAKDDMAILLAKTLEQKEELQAQEEELREANQTLEKQTEELRRSEGNLQAQQEELRVTNQELEKNSQLLEEQSEKIAEKNQALQAASQEIEKKANDLEQASRYKSEFLANMSHELRTPLNSMLILSQTLAENTSGRLSADEIESAQIIYKSGNDLHNLINEILDLSKIEAGKMSITPEKTEVTNIAENISALYRAAAAAKGLQWQVIVAPGCPSSIVTDQQRVEQIIKNLVSNAVKFTSKGSITVLFDRTPDNIEIRDPELRLQANLSISVTDTGIGIPADKQQAIFEAFQQADGSTSRKFGGTGLGLSISRELSRLLGGEVHISSNPGNGSTFTLILPGNASAGISPIQEPFIISEEVKPDVKAEQMAPIAAQQPEFTIAAPLIQDDRNNISPDSEHILVIEDDPEFAKILIKECHNQHFQCIVAGDGESGFELARQYLPAAIILDIMLPGIDGWKVLDLIKRDPKIRHIPVHMMSSLDETIEAYQKGAIGYLKKPVNSKSLNGAFEKIEHFLDKKMKHLLIVEDNDLLRKTMHQLLKGEDIQISEVATAMECIDILGKEVFDCLILDLGLPDKNGMDLIKDIREMHLKETPPIIVYTGQELTREQNEELNKYTKSIIIKGVRSEERLLDEATLFLHRVVQDLPQQQQTILRKLYEKEDTFDGRKVLLADDDMRNIFALTKVLEEKGIKVLKAENGMKALKILQDNSDVNAILMDIMMPEMDGYEAIREIRKDARFVDTPIIALTAKAMKEDRQKCLDAGASDYISKPIDITKLLSLLRVWIKN